MEKCDTCLSPVFYALRESNGERMTIDINPLLYGDVVIREEHGKTHAKVTSDIDPEAMYKRHVCKRG